MTEASSMTIARGLRTLFCNILVHCDPVFPQMILEQFVKEMTRDFLYRRQRDDAISSKERLKRLARNDLLMAVSKALNVHNRTNEECGIEIPDESLDQEVINNVSELDEHAEAFFNANSIS